MSDKNHTPGPWRVCGGYTPDKRAISSEAGYIVFSMADFVAHREHGFQIKAPDYETQKANARLIAASPDLLAACEAVQRLRQSYPSLEEFRRMCEESDRMVDEAVAKAKGPVSA